jgi:hypothetical protein
VITITEASDITALAVCLGTSQHKYPYMQKACHPEIHAAQQQQVHASHASHPSYNINPDSQTAHRALHCQSCSMSSHPRCPLTHALLLLPPPRPPPPGHKGGTTNYSAEEREEKKSSS